MKKFFKKYWALVVGVVLSLFALIISKKKKANNKTTDQINNQITDNKQQVDVISGKIEVIDDQRNEIKSDIQQELKDLKTLQDLKKNVTSTKPKTAKQAKQNILNKTTKTKK